jgi:hypothetical protein
MPETITTRVCTRRVAKRRGFSESTNILPISLTGRANRMVA